MLNCERIELKYQDVKGRTPFDFCLHSGKYDTLDNKCRESNQSQPTWCQVVGPLLGTKPIEVTNEVTTKFGHQ